MSNNKFKVEFTLKQHTPIIHFQSDQVGATLRATELKPKFDRFLINYVFKNDKKEYQKYLIDKDKNALNYKVKIEQDISKREEIPEKGTLFFGNMKPKDITVQEWEKKKKRFKTNNSLFKIEFLSFDVKMKEVIEKYFEAFLANTNFGTRQSKGYGSFYLIDKKTKQIIPFNKALIPYKVYSFKTNDWQYDIGLLYQFLRQGINLPRSGNPFYTKPVIFAYAKSKNWQWDKKTIKQVYFNNQLENQLEEHTPSDILEYASNQKYLLRDIFGLSSSQEWKSYDKTIEKIGLKEEEKNGQKIVSIQRFKSPVIFKVVENVVYFWANNTVDEVLGEEFNIKAGKGNESLNLSFPKEFSFNDFFDFAFKKLNLSTHIDSNFHDVNEYSTLVSIFEKIKGEK
ncbi:hypothetical protein [Aliarcobacter butzleri]|uniref:hypothetical protein n=1 Tax=Aliarcobacter butzleri TaxID=28197 RepID=UPI002B250EF6|nr:hypothetical protein [Aliarcobacter butzleri]